MSRVDRHYRLSRAAYERILERDTNIFPTEKDFVAAAVLFGMGIINADCRMVGEASLIACVQTGFWSYTYLTKKKDNNAGKNEVVA